jgi:MraZ protein
MATFIGDYPCKVDAKGRIILPMAFKKQMPSAAQDHFVVRKDILKIVLCSIPLKTGTGRTRSEKDKSITVTQCS